MRIAVAGQPNAGKSTLFNAVTGARAHVGNYPGVTVERTEAERRLPSGRVARFIDLPGCYSLTARSPEEEVAHAVIVGQLGEARPDLVVVVVDATNLARGLYLVEQCLELELPVLVALNMIDVANKLGTAIDVGLLARRLGVPVVATAARYGTGLEALVAAIDAKEHLPSRGLSLELEPDDAEVVQHLTTALAAHGRASRGESMWLLTSNLGAAKVDAALAELVTAERGRLNGRGEGFNRRVIEARYRAVERVLEGAVDQSAAKRDAVTERLDRVLLHPAWGLLVFALTMFVLFQAVFAWAEPLIGGVEALMSALSDFAAVLLPEGLTRSLVVSGVLAGVGNILVFLPQIALLFLGLAVLEESGYMARAAFLVDGLMRRAGLHGKAFIPLLSSFACAVPGVMAARTIESSRDRVVTILVAPFMSCSARLPVYILVIAAVFSAAPPVWGFLSVGGLVVGAMYMLGFAAAIGTAWVLKRSVLKAPTPPFLLELPAYKPPPVRQVLRQVWERCRVFVVQTGSVILALSLLLWGLLTFPRTNMDDAERASRLAQIEASAADDAAREAALAAFAREEGALRLERSFGGRIGHAVEPLIAPLGFDWRIGIGLVASFAAREVLVSTLGQVYALDSEVEPDSPALRDALLADLDPATGKPRFSPLVGVSLMVFFVLAMQCLSTVATVKRETNSWRWPLFQIAYMNGLAYTASLLVYQGGLALGLG
jgi:ferrous iron transport protein B